jgi:O-antigen ligase
LKRFAFLIYIFPQLNSTRLAQLEALVLCTFAFVLPQFEAPKNFLWIAYVVLWIVNRRRARDFGGPWDSWDSLIAAWIASGYVSALFAGLHRAEWISAFDIVRYASVLWFMRRSGYGEATLRYLLASLIFGTLAALLRGYYEILFVPRADGQPRYLGLNSVGHVNHSAIYVAIAFGAVLAWVRGAWRTDRLRHRAIGLALCAAFVLSIFVMESRATVGVSLIVGIVLLGSYAFRSGKRPWKILVGVALVIAVMAIVRPEVVEKNSLRIKEGNLFAFRDSVWRAGMIAWREYPVFGVGMGNYGLVDYTRLEQWADAHGEKLDRFRVLPTAHGHSLYVNTLVERGAAGLLALLVVLAAWGWSLASNVPATSASPVRWAYWGGALAAWLVAILVGLVNTTLHHEHALISMLLLGGWLSLSRSASKNPNAGT